ncbi:tyrosine-type recombinase/integrase [Streptomyces sp. NPDC127066]|uniref:tyrosine-type recombinase/integrase n=1 Tax=Streptomyces sp. NPDC127066 TaxID=3347125 RepID=UPI003659EF1F
MSTMFAPARPADAADQLTADLMAAVTPKFLTLVGWDPEVRVLIFPPSDPLIGTPVCRVAGCDNRITRTTQRGLCNSCVFRVERSGQKLEEYLAAARRKNRANGIGPCRVPGCGRPWKTAPKGLCDAHEARQVALDLPVKEFIHHPDVRALPSFGPCRAVSCTRSRDGNGPYCHAHRRRWALALRNSGTQDEEAWRRKVPAIAQSGVVSLRGLSNRAIAEFLYGLQQRYADGVTQRCWLVRPIGDQARAQQVHSLNDLDFGRIGPNATQIARGMLKYVNLFQQSPETERHKDTWDGAVFGLSGKIRFTEISQPWLKKATKAWALDDIPKRRGSQVKGAVQEQVNAIFVLSQSLRLRPDAGTQPELLNREDVVFFLNRLAFLQERGDISANRRLFLTRAVRRLLNRMRSLGLSQPGQPLHGLAGDFALRPEDIPDDPDDIEAGRDLPPEIMHQLCEHLGKLELVGDPQCRVAVELLMDTGRRAMEICRLDWDCLERDGDGKPVLIYTNSKAGRKGRRLPISEATAALITAQQERAYARFPDTLVKDLKLLPSNRTNPHGTKAFQGNWLTDLHRTWIALLPELLIPVVVEENGRRVSRILPFDKAKIFPHAYRHTYAQRHADAGVPVDVLKELMDHRELDTTQRYYRVGEKRRREAVERVTAMQFDRRGTRVWRTAKALLDSEHARRGIGEVQVPYGVCTEPSNVAAGGHDCPVRFRCVGCSHFRTDVSYLPDLEAYLADLLRNRERLAAFAEADDWAKVEAMPSDEEITRVRRLIRRVRDGLDDLSDDDRAQLQEAVTVVRRSRQVVLLGLPRVRQPLPDIRPERPS